MNRFRSGHDNALLNTVEVLGTDYPQHVYDYLYVQSMQDHGNSSEDSVAENVRQLAQINHHEPLKLESFLKPSQETRQTR